MSTVSLPPRVPSIERPASSVALHTPKTILFYPCLDRVSVQNGSLVWSELLIPYLEVCGSLARQDSEGTLPTVYPGRRLPGAGWIGFDPTNRNPVVR